MVSASEPMTAPVWGALSDREWAEALGFWLENRSDETFLASEGSRDRLGMGMLEPELSSDMDELGRSSDLALGLVSGMVSASVLVVYQ